MTLDLIMFVKGSSIFYLVFLMEIFEERIHK